MPVGFAVRLPTVVHHRPLADGHRKLAMHHPTEYAFQEGPPPLRFEVLLEPHVECTSQLLVLVVCTSAAWDARGCAPACVRAQLSLLVMQIMSLLVGLRVCCRFGGRTGAGQEPYAKKRAYWRDFRPTSKGLLALHNLQCPPAAVLRPLRSP